MRGSRWFADKIPGIALAAALSFYSCPSARGEQQASRVCEHEMTVAAKAHDIPLSVLYAVGLTETGRRGSLQPLAMNIQGTPFYPKDMSEALQRFELAKRQGVKLIDIGCMQINHFFHGARFASLHDMFDPPHNVDYAARFLKELRKREPTWTLAVARYHAGPNNNPAQKRYVCAVIANMVATGFGAWTPEAREFCK